ATAFATLQDALAAVTSNQDIWVAEGTYFPDQGSAQLPGDRDATFLLKPGVALYGGFLPGDQSLNDRAAGNITILSGDLDGDDGGGDPVNNNAKNVCTLEAGDYPITIDGLTITGGSGSMGAGILVLHSHLEMNNCTITRNASVQDGGGIYLDGLSDTGSLRMTGCRVTANQAEKGGGLFATDALVSLVECEISSNQARKAGGGAALFYHDEISFSNCRIIGNETTGNDGGEGGGGGIFGREMTIDFTNCLIAGNNSETYGGGLCAWDGGNFYFYSCTLTGNSCDGTPWGSGGAVQTDGTIGGANSIFWNNEEKGRTDLPTSSFDRYRLLSLSNCLVENRNPAGNLDGTDPANDPLFLVDVDPATAPTTTGDLRLQRGSPVLEAGDNTANSEPTDLAGNPRVVGTIDLGAYERQPTLHVDAGIAVPGDGLTWATAFATL
ncbi:MAG: hypothetical protein GY722_02860, partial [bacterium]|nr:hypothetical protein [bacterium]